MTMMDTEVYRLPMRSPGDVSALEQLIKIGTVDPKNIVALIGKTEGTGGVNDFTRGIAAQAYDQCISEYLDVNSVADRVGLVFSGGCEGVLSPHAILFVRKEVEGRETTRKRLAVGVAVTREMRPEEIGTTVQVKEIAKAVNEAKNTGQIKEFKDVHLVQTKVPFLTPERISEAASRGKTVKTTDCGKSMGYSNAAGALGTALGLGEVKDAEITDEIIHNSWELYSNVASPSSGIELMNNIAVVIGNSTNSVSKYVAGSALLDDAIDTNGVKRALRSAGLEFECCPSKEDLARVVAVIAKSPHLAEDGKLRGRRTTILTEADLRVARIMRGILGTTIACVLGDPMVYVSGGRAAPTHTGPRGKGPICVIIRTE